MEFRRVSCKDPEHTADMLITWPNGNVTTVHCSITGADVDKINLMFESLKRRHPDTNEITNIFELRNLLVD
jgi:hypothetical protein